MPAPLVFIYFKGFKSNSRWRISKEILKKKLFYLLYFILLYFGLPLFSLTLMEIR